MSQRELTACHHTELCAENKECVALNSGSEPRGAGVNGKEQGVSLHSSKSEPHSCVCVRPLALECRSPHSAGMHSTSCTHAQKGGTARGNARTHTHGTTLEQPRGALTLNLSVYLLLQMFCFSCVYVIRYDFPLRVPRSQLPLQLTSALMGRWAR